MAIDILIVEDEYTERQELAELLQAVTLREKIRTATTCNTAIQCIKQSCPDLILLDIMLRGSSGFEVAEFVKDNHLNCKIIIISAYHEFDFANKALSMGLQDYLLKPVRPAMLLQRIREVMQMPSQYKTSDVLLWPYLATGVPVSLAPKHNLIPNIVMIGLLKNVADEETIAQLNLALHGLGWIEADGCRIIGFCHAKPQQTAEEATAPLTMVWRQRLNGLVAVGIGVLAEDCLAESYRTACIAVKSRIFSPSETIVCCYEPTAVPAPYPLKAEGQLLHALRSNKDELNTACFQVCRSIIQASNGNVQVLCDYLVLLWASIARLCAELALPLPERLTMEGIFTEEQLRQKIQKVCENVYHQLDMSHDSEHPLVQAVLIAIQQRFKEPLKLETIAKEQYVNAAYLGRIFHAQTGQSFRNALTEERMRHASNLLRNNASILETALAVGYEDPNYFSRVYKKYFGYTPNNEENIHTN